MRLPILGILIDERFLMHRLRSTSLAGVVGGIVAACLFAYRYYVDHVWNRDLLIVALSIVGVKVLALVWYRLTD